MKNDRSRATMPDPRGDGASGKTRRSETGSLALAVVAIAVFARSQAQAQDGYTTVVQPYFERNCKRCHGEKKQKGDFRLDTLAPEFDKSQTASRWDDVRGMLSSGKMPPADEARPDPAESARVVEWISGRLKEGEAARLGAREKVTFHRLTRDEYAHTVRDLLGVTYDPVDPGALPEDASWHGFERIGSVLSLSPAHVERYMTAARELLDEALLPAPPSKTLVGWGTGSTKSGVRGLIYPGNVIDLDADKLVIPVAGDYIGRILLSGLRTAKGEVSRLQVFCITLDRVLLERDVDAPEDKPIVLEFRAHFRAGRYAIRICNLTPASSPVDRNAVAVPSGGAGKGERRPDKRMPLQTQMTDEAGVPIRAALLLDSLSWEGPVAPLWSPPEKAALTAGPQNPDAARALLNGFGERAFRRPLSPEESDVLTKMVGNELQQGESFSAAVRTAMLRMLCSKDFIYIVEGSPGRSDGKVTNDELATRLSYFLWSTMPDARLSEAARSGTLRDRAVLREEFRRLLRDPKIAEFATGFPREWLQLKRVGMFPPDKKLYPDYDLYLQSSMIQETTAFFAEVLRKNLGLREFLDSDWTMLNAKMAQYYGVRGPRGDAFERVALRPEDHRGGLLTQASVLSLTSDGRRERPVHRGAWILESLLGKPPPPPPANVKPIEAAPLSIPDPTIRQRLAAHVADPLCASCHRKIDPYGLAFENYDAIGRWRTEESVKTASEVKGAAKADAPRDLRAPVEAAGVLADGRAFADAAALKRLLVDDLDAFATAFVEKLATYALRRAMTFDDRAALASVVAEAKPGGYRLADLVERLVLSELFQGR